MRVEIESGSGFCFGVQRAIEKAEQHLTESHTLYCLGEIVHNEVEVQRLKELGLKVITKLDLDAIADSKMLIRAHGEPPSTYTKAKEQQIEIVDATCPIVLQLQNQIQEGYEAMRNCGGSIVIYGKPGHAEVIGLGGQTNNTAIVINSEKDIAKIDTSQPVRLYAQTTQNPVIYNQLALLIKQRMIENQNTQDVDFIYYNTICRQVSNRSKQLQDFVSQFDLILFVCSPNSSNGMILYNVCKQTNSNTIRISDENDITTEILQNITSIGICGATSTPLWLMERIQRKMETRNEGQEITTNDDSPQSLVPRSHLQFLQMYDFKNHREREFIFNDRITYIVGNNGVGKTNILDAIYYLSFTKSYFGNSDTNNINYNADMFAIHGKYTITDLEFNVSCIQKRGSSKSFKYEGKEYQRLSDHIGRIPLVMVSPYDNELINEGSETRRRFIDNVIIQFDREYLNELVRYNKALLQRNTLLKSFAEKGYFDNEMLSIWDEQLIATGTVIHHKRHEFINQFITPLKHYFNIIADNKEELSIEYRSQINDTPLHDLLQQNVDRDRILRYTTTGIHKDDFNFFINNRPVKTNASQGQQKSYIIALKLAQYQYIKEKVNCKPIILLDDIFANLDPSRIQKLTELIHDPNFGQIFITDTLGTENNENTIVISDV